MSRHLLSQMYNYFGLACLCLMGIVFESDGYRPTAIILMFLTGFVGSAFHSEYKRMGK